MELISLSSKGEILVLLNRTMESVSLMDCGILFQAIGPVYKKLFWCTLMSVFAPGDPNIPWLSFPTMF